MRTILRSAALAAALLTTVVQTQAAEFRNVVVSATPDASAPQASFSADTPEIFVQADMVDVAPGSVVTVTWLAVDTGDANPPNFRIDQAQLRVGRVGHRVKTSLPRPGPAWPAGSYRVRLSVNGQTLQRVDFTIG